MLREPFGNQWMFCGAEGTEQAVNLPHDAMQTEQRNPEAPSGSGCGWYPGNQYVYRKRFSMRPQWKDKSLYLEMEGVYPSARVLLNGQQVGFCPYGYRNFFAELNDLKAENELQVIADNTETPNSRWYSGAGIYRPVWIWSGNKAHIDPFGIRVTTLSINPARISVSVQTQGAEEALCELNISIWKDGKQITRVTSQGLKSVEMEIPEPLLWSAENPNLYQCRVSLVMGSDLMDEAETNFGIRIVSRSADGLFVNGNCVKLRGGCIHHDNGILGAMDCYEASYRKIARLKKWGFNAIRMSHNPASVGLLDACDALGMYVIDEGWDMWYEHKNPGDYASHFLDNYPADIAAMVQKDYNHPSVILYSIGNEPTEPCEEKGVRLAEKLVQAFHAADSTRPVTAGINVTLLLLAALEKQGLMPKQDQEAGAKAKQMSSTAYNQMMQERGKQMVQAANSDGADRLASPVMDLLDIAGYNYAPGRYEQDGEKHPGRLILGTETFPYTLAENWGMVEKMPWLIGDFMWTAWDYLGEVGLGAWYYQAEEQVDEKDCPWLLADTGALDILGNDNAEAGLAAVVWGTREKPYLAVQPVNHSGEHLIRAAWRGSNALPFWSYAGCEGQKAVVEVYTTAPKVELQLNGRTVGVQDTENCCTVFSTTYEAGTLTAIALNADGTEQSRSSLVSAEEKLHISLCPEEKHTALDEVYYLDIAVADDNGQIECNRDIDLKIAVRGGDLLGFGSAAPAPTENYLTTHCRSWYGRAQAAIRKTAAQTEVSVSAAGFEESKITF